MSRRLSLQDPEHYRDTWRVKIREWFVEVDSVLLPHGDKFRLPGEVASTFTCRVISLVQISGFILGTMSVAQHKIMN